MSQLRELAFAAYVAKAEKSAAAERAQDIRVRDEIVNAAKREAKEVLGVEIGDDAVRVLSDDVGRFIVDDLFFRMRLRSYGHYRPTVLLETACERDGCREKDAPVLRECFSLSDLGQHLREKSVHRENCTIERDADGDPVRAPFDAPKKPALSPAEKVTQALLELVDEAIHNRGPQ